MSELKISIVIPAFQEEKLIEKILLQFTAEIKQKHKLEIIVSDGGSTDKTLEIAKKYADKVVLKEGDYKQNISIGRNIGAKNANGEILLFINADTLINNIDNFLNSICKGLEYPNVVGATCPVYIHPDEETFSDKLFHIILNNYFFLLNKIGIGMGRGECQAVKRDLFNRVGGYNQNIAAGEDFDLFKRLRRYGKINFLWELKVYESPRRYRRSGYIRVILSWLFNAIVVIIFKRSILDEWKPIR